jgi:hypothetical protein
MADGASTAQRVADLRRQLQQLATRIDPFPVFPGAVFAYGIEVEPEDGPVPDLGCVILGDDGALYELEIGLDSTRAGEAASGERYEELKRLDVPDEVYVAYAEAAVRTAERYLGSQDLAEQEGSR